jgi:hypothetical protein
MPTDNQDSPHPHSDNTAPVVDEDAILGALGKLSARELVARIGRLPEQDRADLLAEPVAQHAYAELLESVRDELTNQIDRFEREAPWLAVALSKPWAECERELLARLHSGEFSTGAFVASMMTCSANRTPGAHQPGDVLAAVLDLLGVQSGNDLRQGPTRAVFDLIVESLRSSRPDATDAERAAVGQALAGLRRRALKGGLPDDDGVLEPAEELNRRMWAIIDRYAKRSVDLDRASAIHEVLRLEVHPRYAKLTPEQVQEAMGDSETSTRIRTGRLRVMAGLYRPKPGESQAEAAFTAGRAVEKSRKPTRE